VACLQFRGAAAGGDAIALVPTKDLIFVGAGIAAAGMTKVSVTPSPRCGDPAAADLVLAATVASLAWLLDREAA